jgi:CheY-like chemotaxis protein
MLPLRLLLVDDSPAFLKSATRFLSVDTRLLIVGCVLSGREALEQVPKLSPDLVLMDLAMPGMNGLEATQHIKAQPNAPYIVILTLNDNTEYRAAASAVGADAFVSKLEIGTALLPLIRSLFTELRTVF